MIELKPFDVVVVDGQWYMPHHWLIKWRSLDKGVHCVAIMNDKFEIWNPTFTGIKGGLIDGKMGHLDYYRGRYCTIHRYKKPFDNNMLTDWAKYTDTKSQGYDFINQWLLGFVCGMATKSISNAETKWTCAEFPYWAFQDNGYKLTEIPETLPMPRLFRYNTEFECIYKGII
jgi:hypothetical protein